MVSPNMIKNAKVIFTLDELSNIHVDGEENNEGYQVVKDDVKF
jgi:hypothetical protein